MLWTKVILAAVVCMAAVASGRVLYSRTSLPKGWMQTERVQGQEQVSFMVAIRQQNLDQLESMFWAVADPSSAQYRQFKSIDEIDAVVRPKEEDRRAVFQWLHEASISMDEITDLNDALEVRTSAFKVERLLSTELRFFINLSTGRSIIRHWGPISVPAGLESIVEMIVGLSSFPVSRKAKVGSGDLAIVPQTISAMYKLNNAQGHGTSQGVIEFEDQYFSPSDLSSFAKDVGMDLPKWTSNHIIGQNDPSQGGDEAMLDVEMVAAVAPASTNWFWIEGDSIWLYGFSTHFYSTASIPEVISISYGWDEADQCEDGIGGTECQQLGVNSVHYVQRVNAQFQKIGLRGVSILISSGDSGVYGRSDPSCSDTQFHPDFPAGSPYVTVVGATQITNPISRLSNPPPVCDSYSCASGGDEVAVSYDQAGFASGGGFSNVAAQPSYQSAAVRSYLSSGVKLPPSTYFNHSGRAYPDVAAFGSAIYVYNFGGQLAGGTSASSPIFAAVVSLLNEYAKSKTGKPLGFLNPFLYQAHASHPAAFRDIVTGDNRCTEQGCSSSCKGFEAFKGWDPVTGLGSPVYTELLAYLKTVV